MRRSQWRQGAGTRNLGSSRGADDLRALPTVHKCLLRAHYRRSRCDIQDSPSIKSRSGEDPAFRDVVAARFAEVAAARSATDRSDKQRERDLRRAKKLVRSADGCVVSFLLPAVGSIGTCMCAPPQADPPSSSLCPLQTKKIKLKNRESRERGDDTGVVIGGSDEGGDDDGGMGYSGGGSEEENEEESDREGEKTGHGALARCAHNAAVCVRVSRLPGFAHTLTVGECCLTWRFSLLRVCCRRGEAAHAGMGHSSGSASKKRKRNAAGSDEEGGGEETVPTVDIASLEAAALARLGRRR